MKTLFITYSNLNGRYGGSNLSNIILSLMMDNSEVDIIHVETIRELKNEDQIRFFGRFLRQCLRGHDPRQINLLEKTKQYSKNQYSTVVLDSTFLGTMVLPLRKMHPASKIVVIAHNNEYRYHKIAVQMGALLKSVLIPIAYKAELLSSRYADKIICFSDRNARYFNSLAARKVVNIRYPIRERTAVNPNQRLLKNGDSDIKIGYIGSDNIFNRRAVETIADFIQLAPKIQLKVAGSVIINLNKKQNILHSGVVDDLSEFYDSVDAVVNPVKIGEGIKIKTFEALEHRVPVIGFKEAFEGVEVDEFGGKCVMIRSLNQIESELLKIRETESPKEYKLTLHRPLRFRNIMVNELF